MENIANLPKAAALVGLPELDVLEYARAKAKEAAGRHELTADAKASGLDYSWLSKFANGKIPNPGYRPVVTLAKFYRARELAAAQSAAPAPHAPGASA